MTLGPGEVTMADVGDHIEVAAAKGAPSKHGVVLAKTGSMLTIEWDDGRRSSFFPAPGAVSVRKPAAAERR
jgi:hypothetical protein